MKLRVVIDTNVVVSGVLSANSYPGRILDAWLAGNAFEAVLSQSLKDEINEVLNRPKIKRRLPKDVDVGELTTVLFATAVMLKPKTIKRAVFVDQDDHFLYELAVTSGARRIVTGDAALLSESIKGCRIVSPKVFCDELAG